MSRSPARHDRAALGDRFPHDVAERLIGRRDHRRGQRAAERAVGRVGAFEQHVERQLLEKLRCARRRRAR